mgnify:FL=1|jgi:hypothetical protein
MSKDNLTFKDYIYNYVTSNTLTFCNIFSERLDKIKTTSSKSIIQDLSIDNNFEMYVFKNTYMDYFRKKFDRCLQI